MNIVTLTGHLGQDPEAKALDGGRTLCRLSLATNKRWTDGSGARQERTDWHRVVAFGSLASTCAEYLGKGSHVAVVGELQTNTWTDDAGTTRRDVQIVAKNVEFLDKLGTASEKVSDGAPEFTDDDVPF